MIFASPVHGTIYLTAGNGRWFRSQPFGCTGFAAERPLGKCAHYHRGVDISRGPAGCGDDAFASQAGTIHFAGKVSDGAIVVEIDHGGGIFTAYAHLQAEVVSVGQKVARGQKIGLVGKTGNATGCHVHLALKTGASGSHSILDDGNGKWEDIWPHLAQNVTGHPKNAGINVRSSKGSGTTLGPAYAHTDPDGHIRRLSDGVDLGLTSAPRDWDWPQTGAHYPAGQGYAAGTSWTPLVIDGRTLWVATPLVQTSA